MDIAGVTALGTSFITSYLASPSTSKAANASSSQSSSSQSSAQAGSASSTSAAIYASPIFTIDPLTGAFIEEWRDPQTGAELYQSPSRVALLYGKSQDLGGTASLAASAHGRVHSLSLAA